MSVLACLFHSYDASSKALLYLGFYALSTTAVEPVGLIQAVNLRQSDSKKVSAIVKKHLNGSDSEQLHPSFGLSTGRTQDNAVSQISCCSCGKRFKERKATCSHVKSTTELITQHQRRT